MIACSTSAMSAADRSVDRTLILSLAVLMVVLVAFSVLMRWHVPAAIAILIWGAASFALVPPLQMRVMENGEGLVSSV